MSIEVISFILFYAVISIIVYYIVKGILILELNSENELDMSMKKDKPVITAVCIFVGLIWIIYVPYIIIRTVKGEFQRD